MTSWTRKRSNEPDNRQVPPTAPRAQARSDRRHGIIFCSVVLVGASAVFAVLMLNPPPSSSVPAKSPTMSGDMPGMDHGEGHGSTPWPSASPDVPATDHGDGHGSSPSPTMAKDMPGMDHGSAEMPGSSSEHGDAAAVVTDRPLAPVLGTFGGASSAVMLSAVFLRRRDLARAQAKAAARAARRTQR